MTSREVFKAAVLAGCVEAGLVSPGEIVGRLKTAAGKLKGGLMPGKMVYPAEHAEVIHNELLAWGDAFSRASEEIQKQKKSAGEVVNGMNALFSSVRKSMSRPATPKMPAIAVKQAFGPGLATALQLAPLAAIPAGLALMSPGIRSDMAGLGKDFMGSPFTGALLGSTAGALGGYYTGKGLGVMANTTDSNAVKSLKDYEVASEYDRNTAKLKRRLQELRLAHGAR